MDEISPDSTDIYEEEQGAGDDRNELPLTKEDVRLETELYEMKVMNAAAQNRAREQHGKVQGYQSVKSAPAPNGCFLMLFENRCPRGNDCTYSHSPAVLAQSWNYYIRKLQNSKFKPSGQVVASGRSNSTSSLSHMSLVAERILDGLLHPCLQTAVLNAWWNTFTDILPTSVRLRLLRSVRYSTKSTP